MAPLVRALLLLAPLSVAADAPAKASTAAFTGDRAVVNAKLFHGIIPEDFRAYFDRDPERATPAIARALVAPADGIVLDVTEDADSRTLVVSLGLWDVHVQRVPLAGRVLSIREAGLGHLSTSDPRHFANVRKETTVESAAGAYVLTQITGINTKRIQVFVREGEELRTGQRFGRILLGSTVTLRVPKTVTWTVGRFQRVWGGETVVGRY